MKGIKVFVNCLSVMGQAISSTQFYIFGKKHCTQTGYYRHVKSYDKAFPVQTSSDILRGAEGSDGIDMDGKVVVITGYVLLIHIYICICIYVYIYDTNYYTVQLVNHNFECLDGLLTIFCQFDV